MKMPRKKKHCVGYLTILLLKIHSFISLTINYPAVVREGQTEPKGVFQDVWPHKENNAFKRVIVTFQQ